MKNHQSLIVFPNKRTSFCLRTGQYFQDSGIRLRLDDLAVGFLNNLELHAVEERLVVDHGKANLAVGCGRGFGGQRQRHRGAEAGAAEDSVGAGEEGSL